jgi:WD40 repeat protein
MKELGTIILDFLSSRSSPLALSEFTRDHSEFWESEIHSNLISLWKDGKVFASEVIAEAEGYLPSKQASWTVERSPDFFGYSQPVGVYQLGAEALLTFEVKLWATLNIGSPVYSIAVSPVEDIIAVGDDAGVISIYSLSNVSVINRQNAHSGRIWSLDYSPDGTKLISGSLDGQIALWTELAERIRTVGEVDDWVTSVRFSPDGGHVLTGHKLAVPTSPSVRIWSLDEPDNIQNYIHHDKNVYCVEYLPDSSGFISCGSDNNVACWSFGKDALAFQIRKHTGTVSCMAVHPSADYFASGAWTGTIKIWNAKSGAVMQTIEAHSERVTSLKYGRSGNYLASGSKDSTIALWKVPECILISRTLPGQGWVRALAFDNRDLRLLSGSSDGYVRIWGIER